MGMNGVENSGKRVTLAWKVENNTTVNQGVTDVAGVDPDDFIAGAVVGGVAALLGLCLIGAIAVALIA